MVIDDKLEVNEGGKKQSPLSELSKDAPSMDNGQSDVSFGKVTYSPEEIAALRAKVESLEYTVSVKRSNVRNWETKVSLNDTKEKRMNGDYVHACTRLAEAKSELSRAESELKAAKVRLNNAL